MVLLEVVAVVVVLVLLAFYFNKDPPGLPPGPPRYPFIGCLSQNQTIEESKQFQKKYGDIFSVRIGSKTMVTICNYKTIKEAFSRYEFIDRPKWEFLNFFSNGELAGVIFRNGVPWQTLRRFLLRNLRDMGMGKSRLDDVILREAEELVKDFKKYTHGPTFFPGSISVATLNIIWQLVASRRYDMDDEEIIKFVHLVQEFQEDITVLALPVFFPWLKYLPGPLLRRLCREDKLEANAKIGRNIMEEAVREHRASLNPDSPRDVLDEFLLEMENQKNDPNSVFNEQDLIKTIFDLFTAGYDTTSNMLRWVILHMANQPEVQRRVQHELDKVVGRATLPSHVHRSQLPYLDATINEVLRVSAVASNGVPHAAVHDTYLDQHFIPKGTIVVGNIGFCHSDPNYWDEPEEFRPERFLNESGKLSVPKEAFLPFGIGKRSCLGEALARMELYVFSAALLQNFTFGVPEGRSVDFSPRFFPGNNFPKDQEIVIKLRH
ncbi:cytochrome P450 2L1-like [Portunus trituberculatus]|uniref:cytochrome P450 2L1-like n=1 Tax=Portunus trituberculatus TaxID=210409 RepID=UPI001E1CE9C3|nr:cytochrome P450 2L1-like [Portunus trituberculatus]XP_045135812.1 cytochrome P450 2L1-like [Portunus trituberculatus]XP_045135813.1 cytochrome P450 2L1-like [Portunus trituberculatus]